MHTPGPWEADENEAGERCVIGSDHTVVCYMSGSGPQTNADERLIAAAPELLEALTDIADGAERPALNEYTKEQLLEAIRNCGVSARAAIRKATE